MYQLDEVSRILEAISGESPTRTVSPRVHVCEPGLAPSQKGFQIPHLDPGTSLRVGISAWPARVTPRTGTHIRPNAHFALRSPRHLGTRWPARVTSVPFGPIRVTSACHMWSLYSVYTHLTTLVRPCGDLVTPSGHLDHFGPAPVADLGTYLLGTHLRARPFWTHLAPTCTDLARIFTGHLSSVAQVLHIWPLGTRFRHL